MTNKAVTVAEYILTKQGPMSAMKLHRLLYLGQAWHLAWDGEPLFDAEIHAWANGPVVPEIYQLHVGRMLLVPGQLRLAAAFANARIRVCPYTPGRWAWYVDDPYSQYTHYSAQTLAGTEVSAQLAADAGRAALRKLHEAYESDLLSRSS